MDRFQAMKVFVTVAETGGFTAAAQQLNMRLPTVSRQVSELEAHLGVQLLTRTTRSVSLTELGIAYLRDAIAILEKVEATEDAVLGSQSEPVGTLTFSSPTLFGWTFLTPIFADFQPHYPKLRLRHRMTSDVEDYVADRIDVGVRIGNLPDSSMRAIAVGTVRLSVCACPSYLERAGQPKVPEDLHDHVTASMLRMWRFRARTGGIRRLSLTPTYEVTTVEGIREFVLRGGGIGQMNSAIVGKEIASGKLTRLLQEFELPKLQVSLIYPSQDAMPAKTRHFIDFAVPRLRKALEPLDLSD